MDDNIEDKKRYQMITPELDGYLFSLWCNGWNFKDLVEESRRLGKPLSIRQIERNSMKKGWADRRQGVMEATAHYYEDQIKKTKFQEAKAVALAIDAMCETILNDYRDYKMNPAQFLKDVEDKKRRRPVWMIRNVLDAKNLMEMQQKILTNWKSDFDPLLSQTNNSVIVMNDNVRDKILSLLTQSDTPEVVSAPNILEIADAVVTTEQVAVVEEAEEEELIASIWDKIPT